MSTEILPLGSQLTALAEQHEGATALLTPERTVSYRQLEQHANRLARVFAKAGVGVGDAVTVGLPNGPDFVASCFAAWKLGAIPQPVSPKLPAREQQAILELAQPRMVLGLDLEGPWQRLTDLAAGGEDDSPHEPAVAPHWKIMSSGGSTGRPKLIQAAGDSRVDPAMAGLMGIRAGGVVYSPGPLYHNTPLVTVVSGLQMGATVVLTERFVPEFTVDAVEKHQVDILLLVPTMMSRILTYLEESGRTWDTSSLVTVWHMAAKCPEWLKRAWIDLVGPDRLMELYGGTELVSVTTVSGRDWLERPGTVGRPLFGEMRVLDETGAPAPAGEVGEIYMRPPAGAPVPFEYIGATATVRDGWISVGDLGWTDADGFVYISDRRTDMVVAGGQNIFPAEVEGALESHPGVVGAVVVGLPDRDLGAKLHAVVHVLPGTDEQALRDHMAEQLQRYKQPRSYHLVHEQLRDDAGKVRRSAWRDAEIQRLGLSEA
jgi:bile acid-coenzyme A ligase